MRKIIAFSFLYIFCLSHHVFASNYFSIGGGCVIPCKNSSSGNNSSSFLFSPTVPGVSLFSLPNVVWKNQYETGFEFFALAGFSLCCHFRTDFEFLYQHFSREISGSYDWREIDTTDITIFAQNSGNPLQQASSSTHLFVLMPNLYYDLPLNPCWNFYLGGGIGTAWVHSSNTFRTGVLNIDSPPVLENLITTEESPSIGGSAFAWQVKLGTYYKFFNCLSIGLNYRLLGTTRFQAHNSYIITSPNTTDEAIFEIPQSNLRGFLNNSFNVSFSFLF